MPCTYNCHNTANDCILELYHILESVCTKMTTDAILKRRTVHINQMLTLVVITNLYRFLSNLCQICLVARRLHEIRTAFIQRDIIRVVVLALALQSKISVD